MRSRKITGGNYLAYALYAFLGLGVEVVLLMAEEAIYGNASGEWAARQTILHWLLTCVVWGAFSVTLAYRANRQAGFRVFGEPARVPPLHAVCALILTAVCVALNAWSWGELKVIGEFSGKGLLLFVFQYIYYAFEVLLVLSIVVYGQKAGEMWLKYRTVPWGGFLAGLTWGLVHALTKGDIRVGVEGMAAAILYGCIYLLLKKRAGYAYPFVLIAFAL